MIRAIVHADKQWGIGKNNDMMFSLPKDMKFFRETTMGHKIVMGRKTWESLPAKLPNRTNIVVTSQDFKGPDEIIHDVSDFIAKNKDTKEEIFVIGGGKIYKEFLPVSSRLYLTEVDEEDKEADAFFPEFDKNNYSCEIIKKGKENDLAFVISLYQLN